MGKEESGKLGWRINVQGGTSKTLIRAKDRAWNIGVAEPRKVMYCLKVGLALTFVSLFYYMRPLYEGVRGNAIWAVMTVVVVFEYTVGATLSKSLNKATATLIG
ncbi:hypothetical protein QQ045_006191 [Rhodiola kirilowii]